MNHTTGVEDLSVAQLGRHLNEAIDSLRGAPSPTVADQLEREVIVPAVRESVRREASIRSPVDVVFVLVGGQSDSPILSVLATPARHVVLVHTAKPPSPEAARTVSRTLGLGADEATLVELPQGSTELQVYRTVYEQWGRRNRPTSMAIDMTGGFKTMSAAAAMAASALGVEAVYIDSDQIEVHGTRRWVGARRMTVQDPFRVFGVVEEQTARELAIAHRFGEAAALFRRIARKSDEPWHHEIRADLLDAFDAHDRLEFERAASTLGALSRRLADLHHRDPGDAVVRAQEPISRLAEGTAALGRVAAAQRGAKKAGQNQVAVLASDDTRDLVAMLVETGSRLMERRAWDLAALLLYRASELILQRRIAARFGVDTANVDWAVVEARTGQTSADLVAAYDKDAPPAHRIGDRPLPPLWDRARSFGMLRAGFGLGDVAGEVHPRRFTASGEVRNMILYEHGLETATETSVRLLHDVTTELFHQMCVVEGLDAVAVGALRARHRFPNVWADRVGPPAP